MDDDFGIAGRLENRTATDQRLVQRRRVGNIAIMGDGETARGQIGEQGLNVAQRGFAGRRVSDMADRRQALHLTHDVVAVEIAGDMPHRAAGTTYLAVKGGDSSGFLDRKSTRLNSSN